MFRILFLLWLTFHPVHVSLTSFDYMPEKGHFAGFVRVYLDDLLLDCEKHGYVMDQDKLIAYDARSVSTLEKYLNDKINLNVNNRIIAGKIEDLRIAGNEVDIDLKFGNSREPRTVTITNRIMTELYSDQANMIIVRINDFEQGVKLTPELTEQTFKIN